MIKFIVDAVFDCIKNIEESLCDCVVLPGFPRSIQMDSYSCGAQAAWSILEYYGKGIGMDRVRKRTGTSGGGGGGASEFDIINLLRKEGLIARKELKSSVSRLKKEINMGHPILTSISTKNGNHWIVVYGYDDCNLFISDSIPNITCRIPTELFKSKWDKEIVIVKERGG